MIGALIVFACGVYALCICGVSVTRDLVRVRAWRSFQ